MYPIPPSETLVQTKTCRHCSVSFPITDKDLEFYEKVSPVFPLSSSWVIAKDPGNSGSSSLLDSSLRSEWQIKIEWDTVRYLIPTPTLCPDCRQQRRLSFRNERKLYKRKCDATGRDIISIYSPDKPFKVYHQDFWWSDKWDPMEHGRDFDFGRGFFEQFSELLGDVPRMNLLLVNNENADFCNQLWMSKNCYLAVSGYHNEDCYYCTNVDACKNSIDCLNIWKSQLCYESYDLHECFNCYYSTSLRNCENCFLCQNCVSSKNCIWCVWLVNKEYYVLNKKVSKEEFEKMKSDFNPKKYQDEFKKLSLTFPKISSNNLNSETSAWDNLTDCKDIYYWFNIQRGKNLKYMERAYDLSDCMDGFSIADNVELCYEFISNSKWIYKNIFTNLCWPATNNLSYCFDCSNSSYLFACISLRNKQYCILNKQYTHEEYEVLVPKIIEHMRKTEEWGEFFPSSLSPFGYNETVAQEYYPLTRDQISEDRNQNGKNIFNWSDYEAPFPKVEKIIPADKLPDDISKIPDDILNWAIECEVTKKPFRIIKQELEFYRKHNLPIPRRHPDQRHLDRMALRNPRKLFERKCDKCGVEMITTYSPERPEKVYCWACYDMEVLW